MIDYPAETPRVACCGIIDRGLAMLDGRLLRTTLDARTGEELWRR
ncbi:Putative Quinoprotein ethanol dehydrogenase [Rubellimicrobium mesophilum DSM 19309]|uniref:Putative Quinoprotein ethanol dehydrogenase n=1 Tax=Rubellimicrobium mesophilum DSM 19309 TaxID=442562 RepID=A0A017HU62_9RHOB|nr:hypothetical protein [Rubellimicrobium mesophilum]EYD77294.1 Putative Quinoprotein ethanol dehydrogenase [Rubellimicrobium mesophilum DSM 19309]